MRQERGVDLNNSVAIAFRDLIVPLRVTVAGGEKGASALYYLDRFNGPRDETSECAGCCHEIDWELFVTVHTARRD